MSNRRYHHGDLRAALLDRAELTLREKGADQVTLRQLARDLCVSHAAPSRHFKDRQALMDALALLGFERLHDALAASFSALPEERPAVSFAARLRALTHAYVDFAVRNAALLEVMYTVKHDPNASAALVAASGRLTELAVALIADGQRLGEVRPGPPERIGLPVFATLHGFADLAATLLTPADVAAGLDDVVDYVLRGCR